MLRYYKNKKKIKLEQQIMINILFNEWRIQSYEQYPKNINPPISEFIDSCGIACCAEEKDWEYLDKFNVDKQLFDKFVFTYKKAMKTYDELEQRLKKEKLEKEERKNINLYKKAILELKEEGKI